MVHETIDLYEFTTGFYMVEFKKNLIQFLSFFLPLHSYLCTKMYLQPCSFTVGIFILRPLRLSLQLLLFLDLKTTNLNKKFRSFYEY